MDEEVLVRGGNEMAFETVKKNLEDRGFLVSTFATAAEAAEQRKDQYSR